MPAEGPVCYGGTDGFELIETMRWEPGKGLVRGDLHIRRLERSARELGFAFDRAGLDVRMRELDACAEICRIRLTLAQHGRISLTALPFSPPARDAIWNVRIAGTRLDSCNPLLRHKTSLRAAYEAARAEFSPQEADEVILLNEKGEVCDGTISSIFVRLPDGTFATPPLACGPLAGILREEMLANGEARELCLTPADLADANEIHMGNSLRGLVRARLSAG